MNYFYDGTSTHTEDKLYLILQIIYGPDFYDNKSFNLNFNNKKIINNKVQQTRSFHTTSCSKAETLNDIIINNVTDFEVIILVLKDAEVKMNIQLFINIIKQFKEWEDYKDLNVNKYLDDTNIFLNNKDLQINFKNFVTKVLINKEKITLQEFTELVDLINKIYNKKILVFELINSNDTTPFI
jgi:hypothetical protein